jgi:hypothetical protein
VWVRRQEKMILRKGAPLDDAQIADARRIGVVYPERVRTLVVKTIPPRLSRPIAALAARLGLAPSSTIGMALGYGIFLRADFAASRALLLHELAHTAQYERLGFRPFLAQYLHECLAGGYPNGALEREAQRLATEVVHRSPVNSCDKTAGRAARD